jgi:hypothetical protein
MPGGAITGWIFAGERTLDQPMDRHLFDKWLHVAERKAKLPKLEGGLWRIAGSGRQSESINIEAQSTAGAIANGASR